MKLFVKLINKFQNLNNKASYEENEFQNSQLLSREALVRLLSEVKVFINIVQRPPLLYKKKSSISCFLISYNIFNLLSFDFSWSVEHGKIFSVFLVKNLFHQSDNLSKLFIIGQAIPEKVNIQVLISKVLPSD